MPFLFFHIYGWKCCKTDPNFPETPAQSQHRIAKSFLWAHSLCGDITAVINPSLRPNRRMYLCISVWKDVWGGNMYLEPLSGRSPFLPSPTAQPQTVNSDWKPDSHWRGPQGRASCHAGRSRPTTWERLCVLNVVRYVLAADIMGFQPLCMCFTTY